MNEQEMVETCLNLCCSGCNYLFNLSLYAFANKWSIGKLIYYTNLIEGIKDEQNN